MDLPKEESLRNVPPKFRDMKRTSGSQEEEMRPWQHVFGFRRLLELKERDAYDIVDILSTRKAYLIDALNDKNMNQNKEILVMMLRCFAVCCQCDNVQEQFSDVVEILQYSLFLKKSVVEFINDIVPALNIHRRDYYKSFMRDLFDILVKIKSNRHVFRDCVRPIIEVFEKRKSMISSDIFDHDMETTYDMLKLTVKDVTNTKAENEDPRKTSEKSMSNASEGKQSTWSHRRRSEIPDSQRWKLQLGFSKLSQLHLATPEDIIIAFDLNKASLKEALNDDNIINDKDMVSLFLRCFGECANCESFYALKVNIFEILRDSTFLKNHVISFVGCIAIGSTTQRIIPEKQTLSDIFTVFDSFNSLVPQSVPFIHSILMEMETAINAIRAEPSALIDDDMWHTYHDLMDRTKAYSPKKKEFAIKAGQKDVHGMSKENTKGNLCQDKGRMIPNEIVKMGLESIKLYTKILEYGTEKKKDIRVVIVGKKGSGKTSLIKRLLREDPRNVDSTNGIEIKNCTVRLEDGKWLGKEDGNTCSSRLLKEIVGHYHKNIEGILSEDKLTSGAKPLTETDNNSGAAVEGAQDVPFSSNPNFLIEAEDTTEQGKTSKQNTSAKTEGIGNPENEKLVNKFRDHLQTVMKAEFRGEESANLFLWDFAGDEEFYNTHQIFLAKDVIYIVVTKLDDFSHEQGAFQFWFSSVHCFCDPSDEDEEGFIYPPVIVVGTHSDQYDNIEDCESIMKMQLDKVPSKVRKHIRETVLVSNIQDPDDKLNSLREKIMKIAEHGKNWNVELPVKFILLEQELQRLRELGKPILSFDEIENIAVGTLQPILEQDLLKLFLRYQHEIGNLVYYNDIPECIVLDTQWLADVFKCIVTADKYQLDLPRFEWSEVCSTGRLDTKLLAALFAKQSQNIQKNKDYLVKLMEKFYILVRPRTLSETNTIEQNSEYYVPCLVKTMALKDVDGRFQAPAIKSKSLCFCLAFNFLPPMLFNHLLIACCRKQDFSSATFKINGKTWPAFFQDIAVFNISPNGCEKLLLAKFEHVIQLQVWRYVQKVKTSTYRKIRCFVVEEIDRLLKERFRLTNVTYREKMKCSETKYDSLDGITDYIKDPSIKEFICDNHAMVHSFTDDWYCNDGDEALTTEQLNFTRVGIITLDIMADALYDRLRLDNPSVQQRSNYDITSLYSEHRQLNIHIPSDGHWGGRNKQRVEDILANHTCIGDDIERIRLIRNEMQHSKCFSLSDVRCDELFKVAKDILYRFDNNNKPVNSYRDRAETVRSMTYTKYDHQKMEESIKHDQHQHQFTAEKIEVHYHYCDHHTTTK